MPARLDAIQSRGDSVARMNTFGDVNNPICPRGPQGQPFAKQVSYTGALLFMKKSGICRCCKVQREAVLHRKFKENGAESCIWKCVQCGC